MTKSSARRRKLANSDIFPRPDRLWRLLCDTDLAKLLARDAAFSAALAIHDGDPLVRSEIQARILANQLQAAIATKMGLPTAVVAEFESWFYEVRGRFEATSWIAHEAIQRRPSGELLAGDIGPFWCWIGWNFGPAVLESFLAAASRESLSVMGLDALWQKGSPLDADLKLLVLAERIPFQLKTKQQRNLSFQCREALLIARTLPTEEILSPLPLDMSLFGDPEIVVPNFESQDLEIAQTIEGLSTDFEIEQYPVVQTLVA